MQEKVESLKGQAVVLVWLALAVFLRHYAQTTGHDRAQPAAKTVVAAHK